MLKLPQEFIKGNCDECRNCANRPVVSYTQKGYAYIDCLVDGCDKYAQFLMNQKTITTSGGASGFVPQ